MDCHTTTCLSAGRYSNKTIQQLVFFKFVRVATLLIETIKTSVKTKSVYLHQFCVVAFKSAYPPKKDDFLLMAPLL